MECSEKKTLVRNIVIAGFFCSVLFHYVTGVYLGKGYPYSTFLFDPNDRFNDFFNIYRATMDLDPFAAAVSVYFPFTYIPVYLLTFLIPPVAYAVFAGIFLLFLLVAEYRLIPATGAGDRLLTMSVLTTLSYPVLFLLDRGNLECLVFVLTGLFVYCYKEGKGTAAALFLSGAIAMKLYPAVFAVLFIADRRWRPLALAAVSTLVLTIASASLLAGGISGSIAGLQNNLLAFKTTYLNTLHGLQHNSSLYVPAVLVASQFALLGTLTTVYQYLAMLIFTLSAAFVLFREGVYWKRIAILSYLIILLPQVSYDYKLIHIFLPLLLFLGTESRSRFDVAYAAMFGLLLIPKDYYYLVADFSINGMLNALLMVAFMALIIIDRRKEVLL